MSAWTLIFKEMDHRCAIRRISCFWFVWSLSITQVFNIENLHTIFQILTPPLRLLISDTLLFLTCQDLIARLTWCCSQLVRPESYKVGKESKPFRQRSTTARLDDSNLTRTKADMGKIQMITSGNLPLTKGHSDVHSQSSYPQIPAHAFPSESK